MSEQSERVLCELERVGWRPRSDIALENLDGLLECSYAAVALLTCDSIRCASRRWTACQAELSDLRPSLGIDKDLYLLIVISDFEQDATELLPEILNDTHVCRKLVVEVRGRDPSKALDDVPVVSAPQKAHDGARDGTTASLSGDFPLSESLLVDLDTRSPDKVLDNLLEGAYKDAGSDAD